MFGDEIAIRAQTLVHDAANPAEVMGDVVAFATAGRSDEERDEIIRMLQETAHEWAVHNFTSGCEVADMLVARLEFGSGVREALACTFERWNGNGFPAHVAGEAIPLAMRVVHLSHDMEAIGRLFSADRALEAAQDRRDRTYDPALADLFVEHGRAWFDTAPRARAVGRRPRPRAPTPSDARRGGLDRALTLAADFIDMKSPYMGGHSRRCAQLATDAARVLGQPEDAVAAAAAARRSCTTSAPPRSRTRSGTSRVRSPAAEFDRVELHTMLTEQMLRRSPALAALNTVASSHHEKCDGSGYHTRTRADTERPGSMRAGRHGGLCGADHRARRPSAVLRRRRRRRAASPRGGWAARAARGPRGARGGRPRRAGRRACASARSNPGGLSRREVDVLQLAARGLTTREIGDRLVISPKTADRHIQNIYNKISVSTRAAAALWAMQHDVVG